MKRGFVLVVFALLTLAPSLFAADPQSQPLVPGVQSAPEQSQAPAEGTPPFS